MIPLIEAELEKNYIFVGFASGKDAERTSVEKHLLDLGLVRGTEIKVVSHSGGNVIILIHDSRIAVDKVVSDNVIVSEYSVPVESAAISLDELSVGEYSKVVAIIGKGGVKRRLMDMGLTKGVSVFVRKVAPLGDPIEINIRGYELTLRKAEASMVLVESVKE